VMPGFWAKTAVGRRRVRRRIICRMVLSWCVRNRF